MEIIQWDGKPISAPGIYAGIPLATYHSATICDGPSISSSGLRTIIAKSPAHYFEESPYNEESEEDAAESRQFIIGRAAHHLYLGQPHFRKEFAIRPAKVDGEPWHSNRTACKRWLEKAAKDGLSVLTEAEATRIVRMVKALDAEPIVRQGILRGKIEHSIIYRHKRTGVWVKVRPDAIPTDSADFADYKTTHSVDALKIARSIQDFSYHMQGALIGMAARAVLGVAMNSFTLIFQEKKPPYAVRVVAMKDGDLKLGEDECELAIDVFADCMKRGYWPGPAGRQADVHYLGLSDWAIKDREYRAGLIKRQMANDWTTKDAAAEVETRERIGNANDTEGEDDE